MNLEELLKNQPPLRKIENARSTIRERLIHSGKRLVIIDDDPTGPQAVQNVPVIMDWSENALKTAFRSGEPVFFINTNTRSMAPAEMTEVSIEAGQNLKAAARTENAGFILISRSDSTLRGHYPGEVDALIEGAGVTPDGIILAPAFFEGKRYTVDDVQYADQNGVITPVSETEFSRDPAFSYRNSNLKKWVEEKTGGRIKADDVISITLEDIRLGGPEKVAEKLNAASNGQPVVGNAACYEDLEVLCLGIGLAEAQGKTFMYRCSASFVKARGGFEDRPTLSHDELAPGSGPGLVIAGSWVEKTSRQLKVLLDSGLAEGIEFHPAALSDDTSTEREIKAVSDYVNKSLQAGRTAVIYTSRQVKTESQEAFQNTGKTIMDALCRIVRNIETQPGFVITKGGITSIEVARSALDVKDAYAIGQILPGVPVLRLPGKARWKDIPYVIFPGNVGEEDALLLATKTLLNLLWRPE